MSGLLPGGNLPPSSPAVSFAEKLRFALWGIRYFDILVLLAYPTMGALFALSETRAAGAAVLSAHFFRFFFFTVFNFLFVAHVYIYNDWSDARLNPEEPKRRSRHALKHPVLTSREILVCSFALAGISFLGFGFLSRRLLVVGLFIELITLAYSHPVINLKGRPVVSTIIHFLGAMAYFMGGWSVFRPFSLKEVMLAVFFGMVLAAGHFSNEIEDFEHDLTAGIRTNAVAFGQRVVFRVGLLLFLASSAFFVYLCHAHLPEKDLIYIGWLLLLAWILQVFRYREWKGGDPIRNFRKFYRAVYALFCTALVVLLLR